MSPSQAGRRPLRPWLVAVCAVASLQILLGLAGLAAAAAGVDWCRPTAVLDWQRAVVAAVFVALAAHLLLGSRGDRRAENLGALFLLVAVFYTHPAIEVLSGLLPAGWARISRAVASLSIAALTPTLAWLFYRDFPRALEWPKSARFAGAMIGLSCVTAAVLIAANLAIGAQPELGVLREGCGAGASTTRGPLAVFDPADRGGFYWTAVFGLMLPGLPFMAWRMRHAPSDERRRVRIFVLGGMLAALPPICLAVLPSLSSTVEDFVRSEWAGSVLIPLNLLMILTMAAITAYAVVVQQVLPVRTLLRTAAQYWLARLIVGVLVAVPFALLLALLYEARGEPIGDVLRGQRLARVLVLAAVGGGAVLLSRRAVPWVDRLFFRESQDVREILASVAERSATAGSVSELAESLARDVDRALHLESAGVLIGEEAAFTPITGTLRALPRGSRLATLVCATREPLSVGLGRRGGALETLTDEDRIWLADAGARLLVPLLGSAGATPGVLVLGPKRSELPFSRDDRLLLGALASAAGSGLESRMLRESAPPRRLRVIEEEAAAECERCGRVEASGAAHCEDCGGPLRRAPLPAEPFGKFRLERRVGAGAMGVVYRAEDLTLGRTVVLKTLPRTSPEDSVRLRHEARAMAAITHPNLALIHGAETWQGTPILVIEYLAGGTLDELLLEGPLGLREGLELAAVMARVLQTAHGAGILHRDVKPSNIGFTSADEPKLLDFGLARIAGEAVPHNGFAHEDVEGDFGGTLAYMSPEAVRGRRPEPGFDLWGLSVVAFEAACGRHPFAAPTSGATLVAIGRGWNDAVAERLPECPDALSKFFSRALARERGRRPANAGELAQELQLAAESVR